MRVRLLIDITMAVEDIPELAELIADQPGCMVKIDKWPPILGGRFMGAQPVFQDEEQESRALEGLVDKNV
jgi:hypothetical protein